ncbi:MAG: DUF3494 domain-containing protein, partial [Phycicoccus sp.]|nr:DUF3494 domain-containing protein [Phycicoccus sp.]
PLGTADSFVVLAGETVTNTGATTLNGSIGVTPGSSITGQETLTVNGETHVADTVAAAAKVDFGTAYDNAAGQTPATAIPTELGGSTLKPGLYSGGTFGLTNTLTLDADGDPTAMFVFQSAATLITASDSRVLLIDGANPCNVFWQVSTSATLGSGSSFTGTILASNSVSLATGATVQGRAFASTGSVTLQGNTITKPVCVGAPAPTPTATPTAQVTAVPTGAVSTGDGSTSGGGNNGLGLLAGVLVFAGFTGVTFVAVRRRRLNV